MYEQVIQRTWPILIALPWVLLGPDRIDRRPAMIALALLAVGYGAGIATGRPSLGRLASSVALIVHCELGVRLSSAERRAARSAGRAGTLVAAIVLSIGLMLSWQSVLRTFVHRPPPDPDLSFLGRLTGQYDVILSDLETSKLVPSYGGKVVASAYDAPFVRDIGTRQRDVARFFAAVATDEERLAALDRLDVDHLLLWKSPGLPWQALRQTAAAWGHVAHEDDSFVLLSRIASR
jgi:hypothetical protein